MKVYIANFGVENFEWPACLARGTIATMNDVSAQPFWERGDREGYIRTRMQSVSAVGVTPTVSMASRWFNLMTIISQSENDIWIHSDTKDIWWTRSVAGEPTFEIRREPVRHRREVVVCHKPCEPWRCTALSGSRLQWAALHPKAKDFLATEATLQQLREENAAYALAMIHGEALDRWHSLKEWQAKVASSKYKTGAVRIYNRAQKAAWRMANTAFITVDQSNGQQVTRIVKNKDMGFSSVIELEAYLLSLLEEQDYICALTRLPLNLDESEGDPEMRTSLDRIDSMGHYAPGNIQIVCKFANRWKGASDDREFKRLVAVVAASTPA